MKKIRLIILFLAWFSFAASAQGTDGVIVDGGNAYAKDASAVFQAQSTTQGILIPNVALTATNSASPFPAHPTVGFPAHSVLVYNTATAGTAPNNVIPGYYYNAGSLGSPNWVRLMTQGNNGNNSAWLITGNAGTSTSNYLGTTDGNDLVFKTTATERMRVLSTGAVGINNAAPLYRLDVQDNSTAPQIVARGTGGVATDHAIGFIAGTASDWVGKVGHMGSLTGLWSLDFWTDENGPLTFWNNSAERMRIAPTTGYVGIGTNSPQNPLHVYGAEGSASGFLGVMMGGGASGNSKIELRGGTVPYLDFANDAVIDYDARLILNGDDYLTLDGANLGIGAASPAELLHVVGNIRQSTLAGTGTRPVYADANGTLTISAGGPTPTASANTSSTTSTYPINYNAGATHLDLTTATGTTPTTVAVAMTTAGSILITANVNASSGNGGATSPATPTASPWSATCPGGGCTGNITFLKWPITNNPSQIDPLTGLPVTTNPGSFPFWGTAGYRLELQKNTNGGAWSTIATGSALCGIQIPDAWMIATGTANFASIYGNRYNFTGNVSLSYTDVGLTSGNTYNYRLVFVPTGSNKASGAYYIYDRSLNAIPLR